jgi:hypothetical protein
MDKQRNKIEEQRKMIVITKSDSTVWQGDSVVVIYTEADSPRPGSRSEYRIHNNYPVPPQAPDMHFHYSNPDYSDMDKDVHVKVFTYKDDSADTYIFMNPEEHFNMEDFEGFTWTTEEMEEHVKEIEKEMEELGWNEDSLKDQQMNIEIEMERDIPEGETENLQFYFDDPVAPSVPPNIEFAPEHRPAAAPAEKIIRQELRDDGLTERGRRYVIEVDSKAMYINGEKQPKEIYRKYSKLVESLEGINLEGDETFKLIF